MENKTWSEYKNDLQRQENEKVENNTNSYEHKNTSQEYNTMRNDRNTNQPQTVFPMQLRL